MIKQKRKKLINLLSKDMVKDNKKELVENNNQELYYDKFLLKLEIIIGLSTMILFVILVLLASFSTMPEEVSLTIIIISTIFVIIMCLIMLKIEQIAGYYECGKCHHKYIPTYNQVLWAMHINRTRYLKCPKCNKRSWNKKVLKN